MTLLAVVLPALGGASNNAFSPSTADVDLLNDLELRCFRFFWEQTSPRGIVRDRAPADGTEAGNLGQNPNIGSIASTGFGLTALPIAVERNYVTRDQARARAARMLRFLDQEAPREHGWFYHYLDTETGKRAWNSEISSIDTALLLAGVLTVGQFFSDDDEITTLARRIYTRVDFPWMLDGNAHLFAHGWTPERGFLPYRWDSYSELMILYILGIGSPTHPIPPESWYAWKRPEMEYDGIRFITGGPLFTHQYSHAWFDFRALRERQPGAIDWWGNSVAATRAQREFCSKLSLVFPTYQDDIWGITASDSAVGYTVWGEPPLTAHIDGTLVPSAAGGSLMFSPDITLPALHKMREQYGDKIYKRYGFVDAFNPAEGWVDPDVVGIDVGIILLSAENLRSGFVWKQFMATPYARVAADRIGFSRIDDKKRPGFFQRLFRSTAKPEQTALRN